MRKAGFWLAAFAGLALAALPLQAKADQCDDMRAHISRLDGLIAGDHIQTSRNLRIQDRNNWSNAYAAACSGGRAGSGGYSGGGVNRNMAAAGYALGMLSILRDFAAQAEERAAQEAYEAEQQRRLSEQQQIIEDARRQAAVLEEQRRKAEARAVDDRQRMALINPWAPPGAGRGGGNPFQEGQGALGGAARPAVQGSGNPFGGNESGGPGNPFDRPPPPRTAAAALPGNANGFLSDEQIRAFCRTSTNASMCELAEMDARNRTPGYQLFRRNQAAQRDRDTASAQRRVDEALVEFYRQTAAATIPAVGDRANVDRRGDGYDECRRDASQPLTVVGCYEEKASAAPTPKSRRQLLRKPLRDRTPQQNTDEAAEDEMVEVWEEESPSETAVSAPTAALRTPPEGYRWDVGISESQCRTWGGRFFTPYFVGQPVCEVRDFQLLPRRPDEPTRFSVESSETDAEVKRLKGFLSEPAR